MQMRLNLNRAPRRSTLIWAGVEVSLVFVLWISYVQFLDLGRWSTITLTVGVPTAIVVGLQIFLAILEGRERRRARAAGEPLPVHTHEH